MAFPQVVVRSDGENGFHGSKLKTQHGCSAWFGGSGRHGCNATAPSHGSDGGSICLELSRSINPGYFDVNGYSNWTGYTTEVPPGHNLFVSACGGNGGDGGWGEGGTSGGNGSSGSNASQWTDAGNGRSGGNGGNAGYGTDGGNGGNGGNIEITVREADMNLLMAVEWIYQGGNGGARGIHGVPGAGGLGGRGGDGITWHVDGVKVQTSDYSYGQEYRSRKPGKGGRNGRDGAPASTILQDGGPGRDGSIRFVVVWNDGRISTYQSRFDLRIESWVLKDENEDGIFEPGEHIMIQDIIVKNYGEMPSPTNPSIPLSMLPSAWVDPNVEQEGVYVQSVQGFSAVKVTGMIIGLIKPEGSGPRRPQGLHVNEAIQLVSTIPLINRRLSRFQATCLFKVQYPLQLISPVYVEAVAVGDCFTIQWTVLNISTRPHGINSELRRTCGTRICTDKSFFEFKDDAISNEILRNLEIIDPLEKVIFHQEFQVCETAKSFTEGHIWLCLMLSPPSYVHSPLDRPSSLGAILHPVSSSDLQIQVSPKYKFNHESSYLLIVNTGTPGAFVRQLSAFVKQDLLLELDIYNINLHGTLLQPSGDNVLQYYSEKTIIVLGNLFTFFGTPGRSIFEFMDPVMVSRLLSTGTTCLFLGIEDLSKLTHNWSQMVATPLFPLDETGNDGSIHGLAVKPFIQILEQKYSENGTPGTFRTHSIPIKKPFMRKSQSTVQSKAKKLAKVLALQYPLQNFFCRALPLDGSKKPPLVLMLHEGLPLSARILASPISCNVVKNSLEAKFQYLIVASLPFEHRARLFWELASLVGSGGTPTPGFLRSAELRDESRIPGRSLVTLEPQQISPPNLAKQAQN